MQKKSPGAASATFAKPAKATKAAKAATLHPDPAWRGRLLMAAFALLLLWPALVVSEFKPSILFDRQSLTATGNFLAAFVPPAHDPEFLRMLLRETWQTVAIATAGLSLALLGAIPATILVTERLSISLLGTGRMRTPAMLLRQSVRWLLVLLRSVPELVWALLLVRIVGLGPTAGVLAIALTYCGMLGKVYAEILESSDAHASATLLGNGASRLGALFYGALPESASELLS
ncbi:MAG TPA: ABC transporter permease, partial [Janthinobacterium sp.]|nr:ABC transporter permease [Janthinobacterium sp.]